MTFNKFSLYAILVMTALLYSASAQSQPQLIRETDASDDQVELTTPAKEEPPSTASVVHVQATEPTTTVPSPDTTHTETEPVLSSTVKSSESKEAPSPSASSQSKSVDGGSSSLRYSQALSIGLSIITVIIWSNII